MGMNWIRILSIMQRHLLSMRRNLNTVLELFFWPVIDITFWGFSSVWIAETQSSSSPIPLFMLTSLACLNILYRAHMDITIGFLSELWDSNTINLFASPLKISEWLTAITILSIGKTIITFIVTALFIWSFFHIFIPSLGLLLLASIIIFILNGLASGIMTIGIIMIIGKRAEAFAWSITFLFAALGGIFYPITVFPKIIQYIAHAIPITYSCELIREYVMHNRIATENIFWGFFLGITYLILALIFFNRMFNKSRKKGLARLEYQ